MELPQPRAYGTEGKKAIGDFLSLYNHSSIQQDPKPSQGGYLKTHDLLGPLEGVGNSSTQEEKALEITSPKKPLPPTAPSVEHLLPGGIGTYSISHVSYFNPVVPKPEGNIFKAAQASSTDRNDDNSNCSSYSGSGFTLWDEGAVKKGKTGKEIVQERSIVRDPTGKLGQWTPEHPLSSLNNRNSFSSISSSHPSMQKVQSFIEMMKSAKENRERDDEDDDEFAIKKEGISLKDELTVNLDGKSIDQKANTPRSKHSATEQRRRSKINDRFQMLRELIPHCDQKRDKASFLLEVIEYIQVLQEKVNKYEGSFHGWNHETAKLMPWVNTQIHRPAENFVDPSRGITNGSVPAMLFAKLDDNNVSISPAITKSVQKPVETEFSTATTFRTMEQPYASTIKPVLHSTQLQPSIFTPVVIGSTVSQLLPRMTSDPIEDTKSLPQPQPQPQQRQSKSCKTECAITSDDLKEQDLTVEGGTISMASMYSQGLLNTLTQALQSSELDLTQASISVQIDLGKRANTRPEENDIPPGNNNQTAPCSQVDSSSEEFGQAPKRLKSANTKKYSNSIKFPFFPQH